MGANVGSATGGGGVRCAEVGSTTGSGVGSAPAGDDGDGVTSAGVDGGAIGAAAVPLGAASVGDDPVEGASVGGTATDMLTNSPPRIVRPQNTESSSGCFNSHFSPSSTA
jgi:hypothetical protein